MQYTETELAKLIETVEKEFTTHLNKAEVAHNAAVLAKSEGSASSTLAKAEDSGNEKKESKPEKKEAKASDSKESASKEGDGKEAAPFEGKPEGEGEAAPAEGQAEGQAAAAPQGAAPAAGHGYDEEDMAHMLKMYQSMSKEELLAHHDCVRQCLDAMSAQQAPAAAPGAEMAPAAAAPNMGKCGDLSMGKSEIKDENPVLNSKPTDKGNHTNTAYEKNSGGKIDGQAPGKTPGAKSPASKAEGVQMNKSENTELEMLKSELEAEKGKSAELKKNFDKATEVLTAFVKKVVPQGKAITSMDVIAKSEDNQEVKPLSKSEVTEILKKKDQTKLTKSDREAINSFYLGGSDFNTISHLLKN